MKVALVCDWLTTPGGAEKVLLELHHIYPEAPIYTSQYSRKGINWFDDAEVRTGWLQIFPKGLRKFLGPLRQVYFSHLDLSDYDLVISVTGAEAKSVRTRSKCKKKGSSFHYSTDCEKSQEQSAFHLCYCHVPTQYYWQFYDKYLANPGFGVLNPLVRLALKLLVKPLRRADYRAAQRPDQFVTISEYAKEQIQRYYDREAVVIAPPVETGKFRANVMEFSTTDGDFSTAEADLSTTQADLSTEKADFSTKNHKFSTSFPQDEVDFSTDKPDSTEQPYYMIACRQVTWKRVDLAIAACQQLGLRLKVVGSGPEHRNLEKLANGDARIEFIPWVETAEVARLLRGAKGFIFPSLEPFGVAAVEALAVGCPVVAYQEGGSRDFIKAGQNGVFFSEQTADSLAQALQEFQKLTFDRAKVAQSAERFDVQKFRRGIEQIVQKDQKTKAARAGKERK